MARDILALGTSAGGFDALRFLASRFPPDLPAAVLATIHLASQFRSSLDKILTRVGRLPAHFAEDGAVPDTGHIYLAPPGKHLLLIDDRLRLGLGPRENGSRPAIDAMFRSIAACCGPRTVAAVLSGTLSDGAAGLWAVRQSGGIAVVQDPRDAAYAQMPEAALERAKPDHVAALADMPTLLVDLLRQPPGARRPPLPGIGYEVEVAMGEAGRMDEMDRIGRRSALACPDCHGTMWEIDEDRLSRYRCHQGHAYTEEALRLAIDENLRRALGSGLRALEERVALANRLRDHANRRGHIQSAETWTRDAGDYEREAEVIRRSLRRLDDLMARLNRAAAE